MINENILNIRNNIKQNSPVPDTVRLLAVSKRHSADKIRTAYDAGLRLFGENYLQEAIPKIVALQDLSIEWHFIGNIQSKKCAEIANHFDWVQTLDRIKVAEKLNQHSSKTIHVLIQVNIDKDPQKGGIPAEEVLSFAQSLQQFDKLQLRGLMCMPEQKANIEDNRISFQKMKQVFDALNQQGFKLDTLSMGMSQDYPVALQEGANLIRIGTQIFGDRT